MSDLASWYTEPEAAAILSISPRTLRRWAAKPGTNAPERDERPRAGLKPEPVYNNRDVDNLARKRPKVIEAGSPLLPSPGMPAQLTTHEVVMSLAQTVERLAQAVEQRIAPAKPDSIWLTLPEASLYTGLGIAFLNRLIRADKLKYIRDNWAIKLAKKDLDSLDNVSELAKFGQKPTLHRKDLRQVLEERKRAKAGA